MLRSREFEDKSFCHIRDFNKNQWIVRNHVIEKWLHRSEIFQEIGQQNVLAHQINKLTFRWNTCQKITVGRITKVKGRTKSRRTKSRRTKSERTPFPKFSNIICWLLLLENFDGTLSLSITWYLINFYPTTTCVQLRFIYDKLPTRTYTGNLMNLIG